MSDRVITAEALITAKDGTGDVFTKIAGKFQQLGKGAKVSADIEKMAGTIEKANSQLRALDKLQSTRGGFTEARAKFQAQKVAVEQAAKAMREAEKPTKALKAAYEQAQAAVTKSAAAFERSKTAMLDAKHAAEAFGTPLARVAADQARLKGVIDSTTKAIEHQAVAEGRAAENAAKMAAAHTKAERAAERRAEGIRHHGIVNTALGAAAGYASAHGVVSGIEKTLHAGAEYQHEIVGLRNAGRTPEQIAAIEKRSSDVVDKLPTATYLENMKVIGETTQAFGSVEHAMDHLEFMQKTMSVLKASGGEHIKGTSGDVGRALAKTFEERFTKAENFENEAGQMIPAMVASGGVFNPEQLYAFAQQAKGSLPNYSMRFLSRIAPSIIGAQGGDRAGTAANAFSSVIMGKVNDKKQAEEWEKYGLLDKSQVISKAGHVVSWKAGAVKNTALALSDPLAWMEQVQLPAMAAKGVKIDDRMALSIALGTLYRNANANFFAGEMSQADSRSRLHKDEALINQVGSTDDIYHRNLTSDPHVGLEAFNASLQNLMTTVSGPAMGSISVGLAGVASGIDTLANALKDHPMLATAAGVGTAAAALGGAGWASVSLMNGFGLGTSATALDCSATALDGAAASLEAAAVKMGIGSAAGGAAGAVEGGVGGIGGEILRGGEQAAGAAGIAGGAATGALMVAGAAVAVGTIAALSKNAGEGRRRFHAYQNRPPLTDAFGLPIAMGGNVLPQGSSFVGGGRQEAPSLDKSKLPGHWTTARGGVKEWVVDGPARPTFSGAAPLFARGVYDTQKRMAELGPVGDHPMGRVPSLVGSPAFSPATPVEATVKPDQITAKLEGQASVAVTIKVDGPGTVAGQFVSSSGNVHASVGTSMVNAASNGRAAGPV